VTLYHGERRAGVRFPVRPSSRIALTSDGGVAASIARGVDLSEGGALIEIDPRFDAGDRVHVYVKRSDAAGWSSFADVVRQVRTGTGERLVGLRFERPMPQAKVREFAFAGSREAASGREAAP
jgi:hypothetical protein